MSENTPWRCVVCGYVHTGPEPPASCPVCGAPATEFVALTLPPLAGSDASRTEGPAAGSGTVAWRCVVCGFVQEGADPPASCPVCGAPATEFRPVEPSAAPTASAASAATEGTRRILIVGSGIAGLTAAEQARLQDPRAELRIIAKEAGWPYLRLNLTRLLAGEVSEDQLLLHDPAWFREQRIELVEGEVVTLAPAEQQVHLRDGRNYRYDRLILAHGSHPFIPPLPGATREGVFCARTLSQVRAIRACSRQASEGVCIGGGLLGLELAGALARRGLRMTVVEGAPWLLPRQLPEPAGRLLEQHLIGLGLGVRCGAKVEELFGDEAVRGVRLVGGEVLPAQLVLIAAGVRPNTHLARAAGLPVRQGILVDDELYTGDPAILAAGDCAEHRGVVAGIWPVSHAQGIVAGRNAAGARLQYAGLPPVHRLKVLEVGLFGVGPVEPSTGQRVLEQGRADRFCRLIVQDDVLVGACLFGETRAAAELQEAVEQRRPLRELGGLLAQLGLT